MNDELLATPQQMQALLRAKQNGEQITFTALRKGREMKFNATLGTKTPSAVDGDSPEVINLGTFNLDMNKLFGQFGTNNGPVVLHNSVTSSSTNSIDADALQKSVNEAMKQMMEQMQKAMAAPGN